MFHVYIDYGLLGVVVINEGTMRWKGM